MNVTSVIIKPIVTEKSMNGVGTGKYLFQVAKTASKLAIKQAVKQMFNVQVVSVSTSSVKGKKRRVGMQRREVSGSNWKKATVTLKKGEKISLFESGTEEKKKK